MDELLHNISARELVEWEEFYMLEPFGSEIENLRFGGVTSAVLNVNRDLKKHKALTAADCMLKFGKEEPKAPHQQSPEDMRETLLLLFPKKEQSH